MTLKTFGISLTTILLAGVLSIASAQAQLREHKAIERPTSFANDDEFLDFIQKAHLNYMWDGADPTSGLANERIHPNGNYPRNDQDNITMGGSGFGIAGLIVGIERGFIPREEGVARFHKIVDYLAKAERFHGVWPHWLVGPTGKAIGFGKKDDAADLVESSFLMQSLLCARQYFKDGNESEKEVARKIDELWKGMEFDWFTQGGKDVLYWHWSPRYDWEMNFPLEGYNECVIAYILGASSPTHGVSADTYHKGWARNGTYTTDEAPYGHPLRVKHNAGKGGGPVFWAHYSYIGFDPRNTSDKYASYWDITRNHALANYAHCVANPNGFKGYGPDMWGLTASYSTRGYAAHCPAEDFGVITPTAALSSFPYTPKESMAVLKNLYYNYGDKLWGPYGFYDAFSVQDDWVSDGYLAIDQCTIAPMIENYRTGLLWNLFMSCPEIQDGLKKLGITVSEKK